MLGAMGTGLLLGKTGISEYHSKPGVIRLVSQILQIIEETLNGRKAIIIPSEDLNLLSIQADMLGLSIGNGSIKLYTREDIHNRLQGEAIHGLPGKIHLLYKREGKEECEKIDIADIESISFRMRTRALNASCSSKKPVLPPDVPYDRRQQIAPALVEA